jgi:hypothetical protein
MRGPPRRSGLVVTPAPKWWTAVAGAARWVKAELAGDVAPPAERFERLQTCATCDHATPGIVSTGVGKRKVLHCGRPLVDLSGECGPCGCLLGVETKDPSAVAITLRGVRLTPAGKTRVGSASCSLHRPRW